MGERFESLEEFYKADGRRRTSGEADYGVWWKDRRSWFNYRVSYIQATGEVYAVGIGGLGQVEVLAIVEPDEPGEGGVYYRTLDSILYGWAEVCGKPNGLTWVRARLQQASPSREKAT